MSFLRLGLTVGFLVYLGTTQAQSVRSVPVLRSGEVEISGFGAFNAGAPSNTVSTTAFRVGLTPANVVTPSGNGSIGGRVAVSLTRRLLVDGELAYVAGGQLILNQDYYLEPSPPNTPVTQRVSVDGHSNGLLADGGIQVRFPVQRNPRFVPYVGGGGGIFRSHIELNQAVIGSTPGQTFSGAVQHIYPVGQGSAGFRYYFTERIGISMEGKAIGGSAVSLFGQLALGIFVHVR